MLENPEPPLNNLLEVVRRAILEAAELKGLAERLAKARENAATPMPPAEEGTAHCSLNQSEPLPEQEHWQ